MSAADIPIWKTGGRSARSLRASAEAIRVEASTWSASASSSWSNGATVRSGRSARHPAAPIRVAPANDRSGARRAVTAAKA